MNLTGTDVRTETTNTLIRSQIDQTASPHLWREPRGGDAAAGQLAQEAEEEIHRAVEELHDFHPDVAGLAFYELGELQLRMGDLDAADRAFRDAHALGTDPHPGLALLRLARGEVEAARRGIRRALDDSAGNRLRLARLLPAQVETALAAGAVAEAKAAAQELDEIAEAFHSETMRAWAAAATGAVALAEDDRPTALENLRRSARISHEVEAPYEAARARLLLAEAFDADGDAESAELELRTAHATFERLGAARDARIAAEALGRRGRDQTRRHGHTYLFTDIVDSTPLLEAIGARRGRT